MTTATSPRFYRTSELATIFGVSPDRIRDLVAEGRLESVRLGESGWHRFRIEDVERLIAGEKSP